MDLAQLRTFLAALEHGSFSRAAEALGVGQSTVSFHVKALETSVGAKLLDRRGGHVRPTAAGAVLRRYALRIASLHEEALDRLRVEEAGHAGRLSIAASTIPGEYLLPRVLAAFLAAHPRVVVSVDVSDSRRALARLVAHECDLALVGARVRDKRIVYQPFADDEVVLVGRADGPSNPRRLTGRALRRVRLIVREEGSGTRQAVAAFLARHASARGEHLPPVQVGSTEAARRCAVEGVGLALLSRRAVAEDVQTGRLAVVSVPGLPVRRSFHAARLRAVTPAASLRAFLRVLLQEYR
jgi:DNA-binding transcriptional LysR family regulator